jgi:bifunctional non-homologous end joining protein LigD
MIVERVSLYNSTGNSDKEYHAFLEARDAGYVVNTLHGPRGRATVSGTKTPQPVELEQARKILARIVKEKTSGGYTPEESGRTQAGAYTAYGASQAEHSGWDAALLEPLSEEGVEALLDDPLWLMSEKMDGERRAVHVRGGATEVVAPEARILGINRRGLYVPIPQAWVHAMNRLPAGTLLDGEQVGDRLYVFDVLRVGEHDLKSWGYAHRLQALQQAFANHMGLNIGALAHPEAPIQLLLSTGSAALKRELLRDVRQRQGEGVVLRHSQSLYEPGRSDKALKFKFVESSSCIVTRVNEGRRSVALGLIDAQGAVREVGNVTIPASFHVPATGAVVEVRYMHLNEGGALYQPVYLGPRSDVTAQDCVLSQVSRIRQKSGAQDADLDDADSTDNPSDAARRHRSAA